MASGQSTTGGLEARAARQSMWCIIHREIGLLQADGKLTGVFALTSVKSI
jgi:hypothetical protein